MRANAGYTLRPFDPLFAGLVASWVRTANELFWLAPSTPYPLSAVKVVRWTRGRGNPILYFRTGAATPTGYGELNPMRCDPRHLWLGHVVLDPQSRGRGLGLRMTHALIEHAFGPLQAHTLTLVVFPENLPAVRCYEQVGFGLRGEEHQCFRGRGPRHRLLRFEITAGERTGVATATVPAPVGITATTPPTSVGCRATVAPASADSAPF